MPIALLFVLALAQAAPSMDAQGLASTQDDITTGAGSNLPKDDYGLVAWCHGALAGQLELDPIAHADMVSIEGKAKVAARDKSDAEMEKDRREYLHEYERALAAAEKASPVAIHQYGVESELSGYKMWGATRQKQPIWRMLDWGMWDPNDAGCGEAAKRLYNKSSLFGEALKSSGEDKANDAKAEPSSSPLPSFTRRDASALAAPGTAPAPDAPAPDAPTEPAPIPAPAATKAKTVNARTVKVVKPKARAVETMTTPEKKSDRTAPQPAPDSPARPSDTPLRGPQL